MATPTGERSSFARTTRTTLTTLALALTAMCLGAQAAYAVPILKESGLFGGHYYEVYQAAGIIWDDADDYAQGYSHMGVSGHLATLTSFGEDQYVNGLRLGAGLGEVWVGGSQPPGLDPGEGWVWVNGEGVIPGDNLGPGYGHWLGGEPNDSGGDERYLGIGLGNNFGWNDEGALGNIAGFVVEYSIPIEVSDCTDASGCETVPNIQTLMIPASVPPGSTLTVNRFDFVDPRVGDNECGSQALSLFGGALVIPPYLCGSPQFIVVKTNTDFVLQQSTIIIENEPIPGNLYECDAVIGNPFDIDPQRRDVVVWQATDKTEMRENGGTAASLPNAPGFVGAAGEFTFDCGTSLGRSRGASFFVIGMHIDFGVPYVGNENDVFENFVALTGYKLEMLRLAIEATQAPPKRVLKNGDYTKMKEAIINAIRLLDRDNYAGALNKVENFLKFAGKAKYGFSLVNFDGEFEMRGDNVAFMLREKIIPYAP